MKDLISSQEVSLALCIPFQAEPELCYEDGHEEILVGFTQRMNLPFAFHVCDLINPHILICGMTGGGKTFLAKSLVSRMHAIGGFNLLIIDFTGEYAGIAKSMEISAVSGASGIFEGAGYSSYLDLSGLSESGKLAAASEAFYCAARAMRKRRSRRQVMILIDEAWKLMERNKGLETIIREGRKYGVGLITSSQLLHDTSKSILSNMATLFVFKTTNAKSLESLSKSFEIPDRELKRIPDLDRGSCLVVQLRKSGARHSFILRNVAGIRDTGLISVKGVDMEISISVTELERLVAALCGRDKVSAIRGSIDGGTADLPKFISELVNNGADRRKLLSRLQRLGFSNSELADSFAAAMKIDGGTDDGQ